MTRVTLISPLATFTAHDRQAQLDQMPYGEYLRTEEWKKIRERKLEDVATLAGFQCEGCKDLFWQLDVHHLRYPARRGTETNRDLQAVCRTCHNEIHGVEE